MTFCAVCDQAFIYAVNLFFRLKYRCTRLYLCLCLFHVKWLKVVLWLLMSKKCTLSNWDFKFNWNKLESRPNGKTENHEYNDLIYVYIFSNYSNIQVHFNDRDLIIPKIFPVNKISNIIL